ncbi:MAG TPA: DUF5916 domain-containing protein [Bacteroidia bacterium]|nr:DUF5916 domain-containing protein [Bacteroidia bacterium]
MKLLTVVLASLFLTVAGFAAEEDTVAIIRKMLGAKRIEISPKIDGKLDEDQWLNAAIATDFIQNSPTEGASVSFQTEIKILYNNDALYIGAMMYDKQPDSIARQLGLRDQGLNADNIRFVFDTYNTQQDGFEFIVTASGVQRDARLSDWNFNAVWWSNVQILPNGWSAEIAIPWSALRFPTAKEQTWGMQVTRWVQRKFEFDQWALTPKGKANPMKYYGLLTGLSNIESPVRLAFTPYLTTIWQNDDRFGNTDAATSVSGGLGLKYGINESFTLDMTLLPDFSQVRSDDVVKNLGPFEIMFQEQRPFFTEGVDLFQKGDIFYSRRIGKTPELFYSAPYLIDSTQKIVKNPSQSRLINATKLSGRTNAGLGIGILNAFVDNTYAAAKDTITGVETRILTEPRANYNMLVFDKQLPNSSNVFITNANVIRGGMNRSSNVTATGFSLNNKKNTWNFSGSGAVSNVLYPVTTGSGDFDASLGYKYFARINRTSGKVQYGISRESVSQRFDPNDLGIIFQTNFASNRAFVDYYIFNPWKIFNNATFSLAGEYAQNLGTGLRTVISISTFSYVQFRNFWSLILGTDWTPVDSRDFYESRDPDRLYLRTRYITSFFGLGTNPNKKISFGLDGYAGTTPRVSPVIPSNPWSGGGIYINWRPGNRFTFNAGTNFHGDFGDRGWVNTEDDGTIVFGRRNIRNWSNNISASFVFMRDMSISLEGRHYWATGQYLNYYVLAEDGNLIPYVNYPGAHTFSFNSVNMDVVYTWIFAPASVLSIGWKQNVISEDNAIDFSYKNNLTKTMNSPQLNQVSVRVLYYLDYYLVRNRLARKG